MNHTTFFLLFVFVLTGCNNKIELDLKRPIKKPTNVHKPPTPTPPSTTLPFGANGRFTVSPSVGRAKGSHHAIKATVGVNEQVVTGSNTRGHIYINSTPVR